MPYLDGDGYGDPESEQRACEAPEGTIADNSDCNDESDRAYPGAVEICDGGQTDCDDNSWISDAGMVTFIDAATATATDWSGTLASGDTLAVQEVTLDVAGTLQLCEGTWPVSLNVEADVQIVGADGRDAVVLSGGDEATVVNIQQDGLSVSLTGLTVRDGLSTEDFDWATWGGGVRCQGSSSLFLDDVGVHGNTAERFGAGIGASGCSVNLVDSAVSGNTSERGDGELTVIDGTLEISRGDFSDAELNGYLVLVTGVSTAVIEDSEFRGLTGRGAALSPYGAVRSGGWVTAEIRRTTFEDIDLDSGQAIEAGSWTEILLDEVSFTNVSSPDDGACMYLDNVALEIVGSTFEGCISDGYSGALYAEYGAVSISDSSFTSCSGSHGGAVGVYDLQALNVTDSTFTDNIATSQGGGLSFELEDEVVADLARLAFTDNSAGSGGGMYAEGSFSLDEGTFDHNSASSGGGGVYATEGQSSSVTNSSFTDLTATRGAGIFLDEGEMTISASDFADNIASSRGGAVYISSSSLTVDTVDFSGSSPSDTYEDTDGEEQDWGTAASFGCSPGSGCE